MRIPTLHAGPALADASVVTAPTARTSFDKDRTTANEPLEPKGLKGFGAWHAIVRRYDQRNMSAKNTANTALIRNISEQDRAKDVEQLDDVLRTFINETNKFKNRFGTIRDEEKMFVVKKLMPESLFNCRLRGTTMSYDELLIAENIIIDKVATVPTARRRRWMSTKEQAIGVKKDTKVAKMQIRADVSQEGDQRIMDLALQAVHKGTVKGKWGFGKGQNWKVAKVAKVARMEERTYD